jgi:phosphoribosylglycinamide formyltransferase-1
MLAAKTRFVVFASGNGSNARALFEHARKNQNRLEALALICDRPAFGAMKAAEEFSIPAHVISHKDEAALLSLLHKIQPDWALLAGYKRLVGQSFLNFFENKNADYFRVMNVHPSLLPAYPGLGGYERAFRDGVKISGVTIHLVDSGLDTGLPILQAPIAREERDTLESFSAKGQALEHLLYKTALDLAAAGKIKIRTIGEARFVSVEE